MGLEGATGTGRRVGAVSAIETDCELPLSVAVTRAL
jgi:hypothetical protein